MKKLFLLFFVFCFFQLAFANGGWYDSFAIVNLNSSGNSFYDLGATTSNPDFNNAYLGEVSSSNHSLILGGQSKTYKNGGTDVTGVTLYYTIYSQGSRPASPTFTGINYSFQWNYNDAGAPSGLNNPGDQQWGTDAQGANLSDDGVDVLSSIVLSTGTYVLEVYVKYSISDGDQYDNNSGANYKATFLVSSAWPVELTYFNAFEKNNFIELNWETATEQNNYGFDVERSPSPTPSQREGAFQNNWQKIGFVQGHGNTNSPKNYSFVDKNISSGKCLYRLKQIDTDGSYKYSKTVEVLINDLQNNFSLEQNYPNPFNPTTTIRYLIPQTNSPLLGGARGGLVTLKVYDILGNEVTTLVNKQQQSGNYEFKFDGTRLASGIYFYLLKVENPSNGELIFTQERKMILIK